MRKHRSLQISLGITIGCVVVVLAGTRSGHPWMEYGRIFALLAVIAFFVWMWKGPKT